uniref:Uncharacterized protein n=1 Tax=Picea sitchensis TaxID=3332 RepID=D5ABR5_PICSI|nr:unknown [Picea sitchensis]
MSIDSAEQYLVRVQVLMRLIYLQDVEQMNLLTSSCDVCLTLVTRSFIAHPHLLYMNSMRCE